MKKTYKFRYEKLVRDNIPALITRDGAVVVKKVLSRAAYILALKRKMIEEGRELLEAVDGQELLSELADLEEILDNLRAALQISPAALAAAQRKKRLQNGSFHRRFYIRHIIADDRMNPDWLSYHLQHKKKYGLTK